MSINPYSSPKHALGGGPALDEVALVTRIGLIIIGVVVLNAIVICLMTPSIISAIIRGTVHVIVAILMIRGANWARWLFAIGSCFGALMGILTFFGLGKTEAGMFSLIGMWILLMVVFEITLALFLFFSERVNKYFGT